MAWNEQLPEWNATGVEPPASKKTEGWKPDDKPPADWFNWLFNRAYKALTEIRTILGGHVDAAAPHSGHETPAGATAKASAAETNAKGYTDTHAGAKDTHGTGAGYYIAKTSRSDQMPAYADVQGKPSSFPPSTHTHQGGDITSKVGSATVADAVPWAGVSDKPASFAPSAHKSTHVSGGADALTPADIGAATIGDLGGVQGDVTTLQGELATHQADYTLQVPYVVATGTANTYSATLNPAPTSLVNGLALAVKIPVDSTGTSTLNVNGLGAKTIKKANGANVTNLKAGGIYTLRYDGVNFILQGEGASGNATASDLLLGKTATTDAGEIVGVIPSKTAQTYTPGTTNQVIAAGRYLSGNQTILGSANLVPGNIREGVKIFGVVGSLIEGKKYASGSEFHTASSFLEIRTLDFAPNIVIMYAGLVGESRTAIGISSVYGEIKKGIFFTNESGPISASFTVYSNGFRIEHGDIGVGQIKREWMAIKI